MPATPALFTPITFRGLTIKNRIGVSPMCQYSSDDGFASDWHMAHRGARAAGGAGLIIMEATGVNPEGRITPHCLGLWKQEHVAKLKEITAFAKSQGAAIGIQLAHAGRKGSTARPWDGGKKILPGNGGWVTPAPSAIPFAEGEPLPHAMTLEDIEKLVDDFRKSAKLAVEAGFQVIEIHGAHGYLLHEFLSPLSNHRTDDYGADREGRFRLILDVAEAVRSAVPDHIVVGARLSCTDWDDGGIHVKDSVVLAKELKVKGVDFIDCSSGAILPGIKIPAGPNYQVPFAHEIRRDAAIPTAAVGMITEPEQANKIIEKGEADMVFLARAWLKDPSWALHAAAALGHKPDVPRQYERGYL